MESLKTKYMGIELSNPLIVGACNLSTTLGALNKLEAAGAGAIVYKSLFEEQVQLESYQFYQELDFYNERHAEMRNVFPDLSHAGAKEFLVGLKKARDHVKIPLIASINADNLSTWLEYASDIEKTGVDALELNFYSGPSDFKKTAEQIEKEQVEILSLVKSMVSIPVSVKITHFYSNLLNFVSRLDSAGANAVVMFNNLYHSDIEINADHPNYAPQLSDSNSHRVPLRYTGLLYGNIVADIAANTGVYSGYDAVKMILAGASAVQVVSALYKNGIGFIENMLHEMQSWMNKRNYTSISDFQGLYAKKNLRDPYAYNRAQYVDILMNSERVFDKYPLF